MFLSFGACFLQIDVLFFLFIITLNQSTIKPDNQTTKQHIYADSVSTMKTTMQQRAETGNSPQPFHAANMPNTSANEPARGLEVAVTIAGNVITLSVT